MREQRERRVLIVGGGIGGLSAANALQRHGLDVIVLERMERLAEVGAGLVLWSNAMKCLDTIGIADRVREEGVVVDHIQSRTWRGRLLNVVPIADVDRKLGGTSVAIHRGRLLRALADALDPGVIRLGAHCTGWSEIDGHAVACLADGREERGSVIVAADGLRSTLRAQRFDDVAPRYAGFTIWRGVTQFQHDAFPPGAVLQVRGPSAVFGITTLADGYVYWFGSARSPAGEQEPPGERQCRVLERFAHWYEPVQAVVEATDESAILRTDIYDRNPTKAWGTGRMTLLGDAAHPTVPSLGQGACMAIEDGIVLGRYMHAVNDPITALRRYEADRIPRTAQLVRIARHLAWLDHWSNPLACTLRDQAMILLPSMFLTSRLETVVDFAA